MNVLSTLTILPETKQQIQNYVEKAKSEILAGNESPLKVWKLLKSFSEVIKQIQQDEDIKKYILDEAEKEGKKQFELHGCKFTIQNRLSYDFSECNDSELDQLQKEAELLSLKIKARQAFLIGLEDSFNNPDTGEILLPPVKKTTTTVAVTLK